MGAYARMRALPHSAGLRVPVYRHVALAYAAHLLSVTLLRGPRSPPASTTSRCAAGATPAAASLVHRARHHPVRRRPGRRHRPRALAAHRAPEWYSLRLTAVAAAISLGIRQVTRHPQRWYR